MRIYVDIDDILCETAVALCGLATCTFGRHVAYEDGEIPSVACARMIKLKCEVEVGEWNLSSLQLQLPTSTIARLLRAAGAEVDILTGRPASSHRATEDWLSSVRGTARSHLRRT